MNLDNFFILLLYQTQLIAAAAAGVAAEGLSPQEAKAEAENAAQLSVALAENAIVILMLVEDHLRSRGQLFCSLCLGDGCGSPASSTSSAVSHSGSLGKIGGNSFEGMGSKTSSVSSETGGLPLDVCSACFIFAFSGDGNCWSFWHLFDLIKIVYFFRNFCMDLFAPVMA